MKGNPFVAMQAIDAAHHSLDKAMVALAAGRLADADRELTTVQEMAQGAGAAVEALAELNDVTLPRVNGEGHGDGALGWENETLAAAIRLLEEVMHLRMHGERAPGGNETWAELDPRIEAYLRSMHHRGDESCPIQPLHAPCHPGAHHHADGTPHPLPDPRPPRRVDGKCPDGVVCFNHCGTGQCSHCCRVCGRLAFREGDTSACPACPDYRPTTPQDPPSIPDDDLRKDMQ